MSGDVPYRRLRILLVDDNRINLSVLSTLLKRRFGNLLDGQPVSVDSGLKAIQLLRTNVFDCILMDIQMPFLSGLDASIRIRNGEDGVLEANRDAHIVAVTTAVGDEPELAYRRAGMDGMIGKPVRFQDMQHYICPLAHEAFNAAPSVESISIQGEDIMPPLPPTHSRSKRLFYLPANATIRAPQPDICRGADFEKMLRAQTRASLRKGGAIAIARTGTWSAGRRHENQDKEKNDQVEEIIVKSPLSVKAPELIPSIESESEGLSEVNPDLRGREVAPRSPRRPKHSRNPSLTINKRTLSQQIQREMENMEGHLSDLSDSGTVKRREQKAVNRPAAIHRTSSPAWLVTQAQSEDDKITEATIVSPTSPLYLSPDRLRNSRPDWLLSMKARSPLNSSRVSSVDSSSSSGRLSSLTGSDTEEYVAPSLTSDSHGWISRRDSQRSNGSCISDVSTDLPTPANELPSWPTSSLITLDGNNTKHIHRLSSSSSSTIDPWSSDDSESEKLKNNFNLNNVNKQDDCLAQDVQNFNLTITRG